MIQFYIYIYIYIYIYQNNEQSFLCYTVGPWWLTILYLQHVYVNPKLLIYPPSPFPFDNHKFVFYVCGSVSVLYTSHLVLTKSRKNSEGVKLIIRH